MEPKQPARLVAMMSEEGLSFTKNSRAPEKLNKH
jgi:hypothetical protein